MHPVSFALMHIRVDDLFDRFNERIAILTRILSLPMANVVYTPPLLTMDLDVQ